MKYKVARILVCGLALGLALPKLHGATIAHYSFDTNFDDSSGNARNGTLVEGLGIPTTPTGGAPAGTVGNTGIITSAGDFKFGIGGLTVSTDRDYIALPQMTFGASDTYTIAFWARVAAPVAGESASAATFDMVIGDRDDTNNFIALGQASVSRFRGISNAAANQQDFQAAGVGNLWHHYAFVANGVGGLTIYVDNVATSFTGKNTSFLYDTIGEAYSVNTTANDFDFHGEIDEVWVFNEALNSTAVSDLFINNIPEPSSALLLAGSGLLLLSRRSRSRA